MRCEASLDYQVRLIYIIIIYGVLNNRMEQNGSLCLLINNSGVFVSPCMLVHIGRVR